MKKADIKKLEDRIQLLEDALKSITCGECGGTGLKHNKKCIYFVNFDTPTQKNT